MKTTGKERYSRQRDIVPVGSLAVAKATVVGVGAVGRQVALQLVAMGIPWLQLVDHDIVETSNLASQGYFEADLGHLKVDATAAQCARINSAVRIMAVSQRFRRSIHVGNCLFCCVDRIDARRLIWDATKDLVGFFCDARMTAEVLRVLTVCDAKSSRHYSRTLFRADEAFVGPCTARTTIYCANIAAALMIAQFTKHLRQLTIDADVQFNLLTSELAVAHLGQPS